MVIFRFSNDASKWVDRYCYWCWIIWWDCAEDTVRWIWSNALKAGQFNDGLCWYFSSRLFRQMDGFLLLLMLNNLTVLWLRMLWLNLIKCYQFWSIRWWIVVIKWFWKDVGGWMYCYCYLIWIIRPYCTWGCCGWIWWNAINAGQFDDGLCWQINFHKMQADGWIATAIYSG